MSEQGGTAGKKLPYATRPLEVQGDIVEEYIIPAEKKEEVLAQLYLFDPVPGLDEEWYDVHEGKMFRVRDYRVVWEHGRNWLVSPYYASSGGTVIDWLPARFGGRKKTGAQRGGGRKAKSSGAQRRRKRIAGGGAAARTRATT